MDLNCFSYLDCCEGAGPYKLKTPQVQTPLRSSSRHNAGSLRKPLDGITPKRPAVVAKTTKRAPIETHVKAVVEEESKGNGHLRLC